MDIAMDIGALAATNELELIRTTWRLPWFSCRYKLPEDLSDPVYPQLFRIFEEQEIGYFSSISVEMILWILSANCPVMPHRSKVQSVLSVFRKRLTTIWLETDHTPGYGKRSQVRCHHCKKSQPTLPYTTISSRSLS